jgi:hypothetical protein
MKGLPADSSASERFLDAAERLLIEVGYTNITTRRLAEAAGDWPPVNYLPVATSGAARAAALIADLV